MIRSRNSNAPAVPMERAAFLAFFLLFILGSKKSIRYFSINTMTGLIRYATINPMMIGCNIFISFCQYTANP